MMGASSMTTAPTGGEALPVSGATRPIRPAIGAEARASGSSAPPRCPLVVSATFTADPIAPPLRFWLRELGMEGGVTIAPYNQVYQELLDPGSATGCNHSGVNIVLVRFEDWGHDEASRRRAAEDFVAALRSYASASATPTLVLGCPASPSAHRSRATRRLIGRLHREIAGDIAPLGTVHWMDVRDLAAYSVDRVDDPGRERSGHIPYTPAFFTAMATALARRIHLIKAPPTKVIALDCDNTLWRGVVGEDGPAGLRLPPGTRALQEFVVARQAEGTLLVLISKNAEADVLDAFEARPEFPLRPAHLTSWKINWQAKSQNLRELAEELNLGLDSFVLLDDNPIECAEVREGCPEAITLQLPPEDDQIPAFLGHVWAFDRRAVTAEDARRTAMYRENSERSRFQRRAGGLAEFLAGLELQVDVGPPAADELARAAQLTQRTNQFNFTTIRRTEPDLHRLADERLDCLRVRVRDRFGDYGLVGLMIFGPSAEGDALRIDTFLLSCRALGRGVEHSMLARLGDEALRRRLGRVEAVFAPTNKNQPAAAFLNQVGASDRLDDGPDGRLLYRWPAQAIAGLRYLPDDLARPVATAVESGATREHPPVKDRSAFHTRTSGPWREVVAVHEAVEASLRRPRPDQATPLVEPTTPAQRRMAGLWARVLHLERVGLIDEFASLGGTSLQAAHLFAEIEADFGTRLPMTTILENSTVERLASRVEEAAGGPGRPRVSAHLLRRGADGGPSLFLVHDGDGETLLYLNLARRLPDDVNVYGLGPRGDARNPMLHSRISEMAAHYVAEMRAVRPRGPYFLGGMCAGGVIAFEMAAQVRAQGVPVGLVALLDSVAPGSPRKIGLTTGRRWSRFREALLDGEGHSGLAGRLRAFGRATGKFRNLVFYETTARCRRLARGVRFRLLRSALDRRRPVPALARGLSVRAVYEMAERDHSPAACLDSRVVLFRATEGRDADEPFTRLFADPDLGWRDRTGPEYRAIDVSGGHSSMLQEPHVAEIAGYLREELEASRAAGEPARL